MADELGTAVLRLILDDSALKQGLQSAKQLVEQELGGAVGAATGGRSRGGTRRRGTPQDADAARRFNLQGTVRGLEPIRRAGRLNLSTIWGKFLKDLDDTYEVIEQARAVKAKTTSVRGSVIANNWGLFLEDLDDTYKVIQSAKQQTAKTQSVKGSKVANSWGTFLSDLDDTYQTIQQAKQASAKTTRVRGNVIANSWSVFLGQLQETASVIDQARRAGQQAEGKRIGALNVSPVRGGIAFPGSPIALEKAAAAERQLAKERNKATTATQKAAETERRKAGERRRDIISNVAIGAGFPLLFGQGIGAAAGGALGGGLGALAGGTAGFAGSIVGTALGAAFDAALQKAQTLAQGLDDPIKNFENLRQAALLSSKAVEKNAEALIAAGREEEAAALIRADLLKTFGTPEGAAEFTAATDELNRAWTQATISLTAFVAGPLSDFLKGISVFLGGGGFETAKADVSRAREIAASSPEKQRQLEDLVRKRGGRLTADGNIAGALSVPIFREYLKLNGELTQEQKNQKQLVDAMAAAYGRTIESNRLNLDLINASARGNELEAVSIEKKLVALQRVQKLEALPINAPQAARDQIEIETTRRLAELDAKRAGIQERLDREAFTEFQTRQGIERSISNTVQLLGAQQGQYRDTLRSIQQISAGIDEARRKEAEIGFQIGQARVGGREEEAARLVDQQRTAATETRAKLFEGALALQEAGESIAENVKNASQDLQSLRVSNLRFLSPEQRQATLAQLEADVARLGEERGFTPTLRSIEEKAAFVQFARQEQTLTKAIVQGNAALELVNQQLSTQFADLTTRTGELTAVTASLVNKEWVVAVNVVNQAGGASTVNAVNGLN